MSEHFGLSEQHIPLTYKPTLSVLGRISGDPLHNVWLREPIYSVPGKPSVYPEGFSIMVCTSQRKDLISQLAPPL